ncbi:MAG: FkbM family methyltransferase [Myxococcales bacterium]|nr:FkbM family methyltransferase [Myxococcales bacterium]
MSTPLLVLRSATRRLRNIPGAVLVLDKVRRRWLVTDRTIVVNDFDGDLKLELSLGGHMGSQIFWYGSYSRHELRVLDALLEPGMVVADVGANMGEVTLAAAKRVGPTGRVHSFEPVDTIAERLLRNVGMNGLDQVTVHRFGLSDAPGEVEIYTSEQRFDDGTIHEGLSTIFAGGDRRSVIQTIPLRTMDSLLDDGTLTRLDLLKVDVEGAELAVLHGAKRVLEQLKPWVMMEVNAGTSENADVPLADVPGFLVERGYRLYRIDRARKLHRLSLDALAPFQNVLAAPPGKSSPLLADG